MIRLTRNHDGSGQNRVSREARRFSGYGDLRGARDDGSGLAGDRDVVTAGVGDFEHANDEGGSAGPADVHAVLTPLISDGKARSRDHAQRKAVSLQEGTSTRRSHDRREGITCVNIG